MRGLAKFAAALFVAVPLALAQAAHAEDEFPYEAYSVADDVYVRSGPGRDYYPTDKLKKGAKVEVYRHDPGGWCAIRPPEGSFTWVSSRHITKSGKSTGKVNSADVVARVGSKFSDVRDVIQVRLDKDELVTIRDEHNAGGQTWYKIDPPSGEFRWVSGDLLTADSPSSGLSRSRSQASDDTLRDSQDDRYANSSRALADQPLAADADLSPRKRRLQKMEQDPTLRGLLEDDEATDGGVSLATHEDAGQNKVELATAERDLDAKQGAQQAQWQQASGDRVPREPLHVARAEREAPPRVPSERDLTRETLSRGRTLKDKNIPFGAAAAQLNNELSSMVAEEPTVWQFVELKGKCDDLLDRANTALERGEIRRIQAQIERFEDIQDRYEVLSKTQSATDRKNLSAESRFTSTKSEIDRLSSSDSGKPAGIGDPLAGAEPRSTSTASDEPLITKFDGEGVLRPVVSRRRDAPSYALCDAQGNVLSFVTGSPEMNLQTYLGQKVGVTGTRGYLPELRRTHLMARQITVLQGR